MLSEMLHAHFGKKVIILIDAYDTPLNDWYARQLGQGEDFEENSPFVQDSLILLRGLFGKALKDNDHLEKGMVTGILRLAKASLFSGLSNLTEYTILDKGLAEYFGFTEVEVEELLEDDRVDATNKTELSAGVKSWYNGYQVGGFTLYNPWSIMNCLANQGDLKAYWVNTASDDLIRNALGLDKYQSELQTLLSGELLKVRVEPKMVFEDIKKSADALWNLLLFSGYLTAQSIQSSEEGIDNCLVRIPNKEVYTAYNSSLKSWLSYQLNIDKGEYDSLLENLLEGHIEAFKKKLTSYLELSTSYHQTGDKRGELFYSAFMLGLLVNASRDYYVHSERETGLGRADLLLIPKLETKRETAFILEFKVAKKSEALAPLAEQALLQIEQKNYEAQIKAYPHVKRIIKMGLVFAGKGVHIAYH